MRSSNCLPMSSTPSSRGWLDPQAGRSRQPEQPSDLPHDQHLARLAAEVRESRQRVLGLHTGAVMVSEDFDDPLPDDFWLGNE